MSQATLFSFLMGMAAYAAISWLYPPRETWQHPLMCVACTLLAIAVGIWHP